MSAFANRRAEIHLGLITQGRGIPARTQSSFRHLVRREARRQATSLKYAQRLWLPTNADAP